MQYVAFAVVAAALMLPAPAAHAIPMAFGGILSGANETPPNNSPGAGSVTVVLDPTAETIQILASFFGLTTPGYGSAHPLLPVGARQSLHRRRSYHGASVCWLSTERDPVDLPLGSL